MSKTSFDRAIKLVKKCDDYCCGGKKPKKVVERAQQLLGFSLSQQETEYLTKFGYIEFFGVELYGIINEEFEDDGEYEGCMVEWTLNERKTGSISDKWVALKFDDDGGMVFLDHSDINDNGEPKVILSEFDGQMYKKIEILADDLGEYLLELVEEQLDEQ
ncbi:MAG: SMI1/KNR4 family protein [Ruminococcus sp.]|nr:SMI1/KNR4 family protein [Ruminococcus sp.]